MGKPSFSLYPTPLLFRNGHTSTLFAGLMRPNVLIRGVERVRLETPDQDFLDIDMVRKESNRIVVLLHGLEGNSRRPYISHMMRHFIRHGWDGLAMNFRGCSGDPNRLLRSYHSGETSDLGFVLEWLTKTYAYQEIVLVGFSLGGNVLLKYLGEEGAGINPHIKAGVAFSVPCDLASSSAALDKGISKGYVQRFLRTMKPKALAKAARFPGVIQPDAIRSAKNFRDYDQAFTAPVFGFDNAEDYWAKASSKPWLSRIAIPALMVNALDDPFLGPECYPFEEAKDHPYLLLETPLYGGHVAFPRLTIAGTYWSERRALEYCTTVLSQGKKHEAPTTQEA